MKLKLFEMEGSDIVIAKNKKEAIKWYEEEYFIMDNPEEVEEVKSYEKMHWWLLKDLDHLREILLEVDEAKVGFFSDEPAIFITFEVSMELYDGDVPCIFSSEDW